MEIEQSQEIFWMLRHWWYGIIPPWTAFPLLSLCKILPLFMYLLYFLWNQVFTQWPLFLVLLIFCNYLSCIMYSVCIVNIFRALSPFFWFYCKVVIFYPATLQRDSLPIGSCWRWSCPNRFWGWKCFSFILLLQKLSKYSVLYAILCIFFSFFFRRLSCELKLRLHIILVW